MTRNPLTTAKEMHAAILDIVEKRSIEAGQSQYDRKVCISAIAAARNVVMAVPIDGAAETYRRSVLTALEPVFDTYNHSDGQYTYGKSSIGNVFYDILGLAP